MKKIDLGNAIAIATNLGVIIGVVFLAFEIRLSTLTARGEMISSFQDRWVAIGSSWQNEDFAEALAAAIDTPDELTTAEMIQVTGSLYTFIDQLFTNKLLWDLGVFRAPQPTNEEIIQGNIDVFFGNEFARAWWAEQQATIDPEIVRLINLHLSNQSIQNAEVFNRVRGRIGQ